MSLLLGTLLLAGSAMAVPGLWINAATQEEATGLNRETTGTEADGDSTLDDLRTSPGTNSGSGVGTDSASDSGTINGAETDAGLQGQTDAGKDIGAGSGATEGTESGGGELEGIGSGCGDEEETETSRSNGTSVEQSKETEQNGTVNQGKATEQNSAMDASGGTRAEEDGNGEAQSSKAEGAGSETAVITGSEVGKQNPDGAAKADAKKPASTEKAETEETEQTTEDAALLKAIEDGEILALAPVDLEADLDLTPMLLSEGPSSYRVVNGEVVQVDEVSKKERYREVIYTDCDGVERRSPLYCMEAQKEGLADTTLKDAAVKALSDSTIRKLLYFGYGGPGDICSSYDPTCADIDWSRWENRYIFTHMALTKLYSGQYGRSSEAEYEHAGVNRFITKIQSLTIPARDGIVFSANNGTGTAVTSRNLTVNLRLYRSTPKNWEWVDVTRSGYANGFQISYNIKVTDTAKAGNSISIKRQESSVWQLGYWVSKNEYNERGQANPHVLAVGETLVLKDGYYFCLVYPKNVSSDITYTYTMSLRPVSFLLVDGSVQSGESNVQDFGAYVYQGERGKATLKIHPYACGSVVVTKTDERNTTKVSGARYELYAAEDVYEFTSRIYAKDALVTAGSTNADGQATFSYIMPGKYYVKESKAASGYLLDTAKHAFAAKAAVNQVAVTDTPKIQAVVQIVKTDQDTGEGLAGAEFTVYSWNASQNKYTSGTKLTYDSKTGQYVSGALSYSKTNLGKFQVKETKNPDGYTGSFTKTFSIAGLAAGAKQTYSYQASNAKVTLPQVEIRKVDEDTLEALTGAEFTLYEWSLAAGDYLASGKSFRYDSQEEKYILEDLEETDDNEGCFKIVETKNPSGYIGDWEQTFTLEEGRNLYQYTVTNRREHDPVGYVKIHKTDSLTGEVLTDAIFEAYEWDKDLGDYKEEACGMSFAYNAEEEFFYSYELPITPENEGKYKVVETLAPLGYDGGWETEVVLEEDGQILSVEAENNRSLGSITIVKKIKEADITWAHGNPTFPLIVDGRDYFQIEHRYEVAAVFYPDNYEVDENGYAYVEVHLNNVPLGFYTVTEEPVLRYYLYAIYKNKGLVEVLDVALGERDPCIKTNGEAGINLIEEAPEASVTFVNKKDRYDGYSHNAYVENTVPLLFGEEE